MEQFDLTVFKIGLEQGVFDHLQLMDLIYGGIKLTRKENNNLFLEWNVSHFNSLPVAVREQLVKLLLEHEQKDDFHFCKTVTTLANERADCALKALILTDGPRKNIGYTAVFNGMTTPADGVLEIINWVSWGIKLEDDVHQTAKVVLDTFLEDAPDKPTMQKRISTKKRKLANQLKHLEKRINSLMNKSNMLKFQLLEAKRENRCDLEKADQAELIQTQIFDLTNQLANTLHLLGQAEVYPLVKQSFG